MRTFFVFNMAEKPFYFRYAIENEGDPNAVSIGFNASKNIVIIGDSPDDNDSFSMSLDQLKSVVSDMELRLKEYEDGQ